MDLIDEYVGLLAFTPVFIDTVDHDIGNDQQSHCFKLLAQIEDVIRDNTVCNIDIGFMSKGIEVSICKQFQF